MKTLSGDPGDFRVNKFGFNDAIGTVKETVASVGSLQQYINPSTLGLASGDTGDDTGGSGAFVIRVEGVDSAWEKAEEDFTLDATSPVFGTVLFRRVFRMYTTSAGTAGHNLGLVAAGTGVFTAGKPANVLAQIDSAENQTLMAVYTIPASYIGDLLEVLCHVSNTQVGEASLYTRDNSVNGAWRLRNRAQSKDGTIKFDYSKPDKDGKVRPLQLNPKTDIEVRAKSGASTISMSAAFDIDLRYAL